MFTGFGVNVKHEFKNISRATLDIKVQQLDFTEDRGRSAAEAINSWVSTRTKGKINEIISSGTCKNICRNPSKDAHIEVEAFTNFIADSLTNQTQVVLVNAIHFKAPWNLPFQRENTRNTTFHLNSKEQTHVAMMTAEGKYSHGDLQELDATVVAIAYKVGQSRHILKEFRAQWQL